MGAFVVGSAGFGICVSAGFTNVVLYSSIIRLTICPVSPEPLSPNDWAKAVNSYAQALYLVSELSKEVPTTATELALADAPKSVQDVFGASPANK